MALTQNAALPGVTADRTASYRNIFTSQEGKLLAPRGRVVSGAASRDPLNTGDLDVLRAGVLMGEITSGNKLAPSILGVTTVAYADNDVTLTVSAATAVEINRRLGSSGTLQLTGPPSAAGTVATTTVTYSAVNTTTGVLTVTDANVDAIAGSFIGPVDGSRTILYIQGKADGLKVTDEDGTSIDVQAAEMVIGGQIDSSQLVNWPTDTSLIAYVKAALRAAGYAYAFDDDLGA
jgi:hypothetical protein